MARRDAYRGTDTIAQRSPGAPPHCRPAKAKTREPSQRAIFVFGKRRSASARAAKAMRSKTSAPLGATSCSVTFDNTNCGDCNSGYTKTGEIRLYCGP